MTQGIGEKPNDLLELWGKNIQRIQTANHESANWFSRLHLLMGVPTVLITATVGVSAVTEGLKSYPVLLIGLSVLATVMSSLQAFLNYGDRAAKHGNAGTEYGCLKRRLQEFRAFDPKDELEVQTFVKELRESFDSLSRATPQIPTHIWDRMLTKFPPQRTANG